MYADRYAGQRRFQPASLAVAIGINALVIGGLVLSSPVMINKWRDRILTTTAIPLDPVPPEIKPEPKPQPQQKTRATPEQHIETVSPRVDTRSAAQGPLTPDFPPQPPQPPMPGTGGGTAIDPPAKPALFVAATVDPRFANAFQPDYPASERRIEREGVVRIRVLIGTDGRVKQAERVEATSDAFWQAAERQALRSWRFKPATRDGVAEESWRVMTLTFVLRD